MLRKLFIIALFFVAFATQATLKFHQDSHFVFASVAEAQALLARPDDYLTGLSLFDLQSRLQRADNPDIADFIRRARSEVMVWSHAEQKRLSKISRRLARKLRHYELPLPAEIMLIKVEGKMEAGAAYTRHNAIVLPINYLQSKTDQQLEFLLAHELFHIISRHSPELRRQAYAIIGFKPCSNTALPEPFARRKISNPDAPRNDYYIEVTIAGDKKAKVMPIILANTDTYKPNPRRTFFDYLQLLFMEVEESEETCKAVINENDMPVLHQLNEIDDFFQQVGTNTRYIIHEEEIMADNFAMMVMKTEPLPSPDIHKQLSEILQERPRK